MSDLPLVSIIIPTHNRGAVLLENLQAFHRQTYPPERMQVIIVADGCRDDTAQVIRAFHADFTVVLLEQPALGPSAARNHGAEMAAGDYLIFVDDDIEICPGFVAAHVRALSHAHNRVVIGYLPPALQVQRGMYKIALRGWWEEKFTAMESPWYRFQYSDLLTGNFSISAALFRQLNGFCTDLHTHEDFEFGYRLLAHGAQFYYEREAWGFHHERTLLERTFQRKINEGLADVAMTKLHPDLFPILQVRNLAGYGSLLQRFFFRQAFDHPRLGEALAGFLRRLMNLFETLRLRRLWRKQLTDILVFWYLRGVSSAIGSYADWLRFVAEWEPRAKKTYRVIDIDLAHGIEAAEMTLEQEKPDGVRLYYRDQFIGQTRLSPGQECIGPRHLRGILSESFYFNYLLALAPEKLVEETAENQTLRQMYQGYLRQCNIEPGQP